MKTLKYIPIIFSMLILANIKEIEDIMLKKYRKYKRIYR